MIYDVLVQDPDREELFHKIGDMTVDHHTTPEQALSMAKAIYGGHPIVCPSNV